MLRNAPLYSYVPAKDPERARRFYSEKLDLGAGEPVAGGFSFQCGDNTAFFIYPTPNAGTNQASCAFWQVNDIRSVVAWLKGRGVKFEHYEMHDGKWDGDVFTGGGAHAAWFKDTEGNTMAVIEDAPGG